MVIIHLNFFSEVVFWLGVDDKIDSYKDLDVRGKAVLIMRHTLIINLHKQEAMSPGRHWKITRSKKGAVAVFLFQKSLTDL